MNIEELINILSRYDKKIIIAFNITDETNIYQASLETVDKDEYSLYINININKKFTVIEKECLENIKEGLRCITK